MWPPLIMANAIYIKYLSYKSVCCSSSCAISWFRVCLCLLWFSHVLLHDASISTPVICDFHQRLVICLFYLNM